MKQLLHYFAFFFALEIFVLIVVSGCFQKTGQNFIDLEKPIQEECRVVSHVMGKSCIPAEPQRVVILASDVLGNALALGIKPVGATSYYSVELEGSPFPEHLQDKLSDTKFVGNITQPNLEKILQLKPDLILTNTWSERAFNSYEKLSRIAPTVVLSLPETSQRDWKKILLDLAIVLDREQEAKRLLDEYRQRISSLKEALGDQGHQIQVSVATVEPQFGVYAYGKQHAVGRVLSDLELQRPSSQRGDFYFISNISMEQLSSIDGDILFFLTWKEGEYLERLEKLKQDPLWKKLTAVQNDQVYFVDAGHWHAFDVLAVNAVLDDLFRYLVKEDVDQKNQK